MGDARAGIIEALASTTHVNLKHGILIVNRQFCAKPLEQRDYTSRNPESTSEKREKIGVQAMINRENAWGLLCEYTLSESLRKHAMAVESCMRAYAKKFGEDDEKWAITGLIHDFDYEKWPSLDDHPFRGNEIPTQQGYPEDIRRAILSHADYSGVSRDSKMEKALFACDELAGFITAASLVRPDKSIFGLEPRSVRKRMKDKAFARTVNRDDIVNGAADLGIDLDEHIAFCIEAMKTVADQLGLTGVRAESA